MSYLSGSQEVRKVNKDSYLTAHNKIVNALLDNAECRIVCDAEDQDLIYGFVIYEKLKEWDILHYIYVRNDFRARGITHEMLLTCKKNGSDQLAISHKTDSFTPARLKKYWSKVIYDPYLQVSADRRIN